MLLLYRGRQVLLTGAALGVFCGVLSAGCTEVEPRHGKQRSNPNVTSDGMKKELIADR